MTSPRAHHRHPTCREHRERGAVLVMLALSLTVFMAVTAFAVDFGRALVMRRDLQSIADLAAIDSSRFLTGASASSQLATIRAAAVRSAERNDAEIDPNRVHLVRASGDDWVVIDNTTQVPEGVLVNVRDSVSHLFVPGDTSTEREAVASRVRAGGVEIGTSLATVNTTQATMLNFVFGLLGGNPTLNLSLVSWQGLAAADVSLGSLAAAAHTTEDAYLSTSASLGHQLDIVADALTADGYSAAATATTSLRAGLSASVAATSVRMGDLLVVSGADASTFAGATFDATALARGALSLARDGGTVSGSLAAGVPGIATVSVSLHVVEPPSIAFGPTGVTASTGQVAVSITTTLAAVPVSIGVGAATGTATLVDVSCGTAEAATSASARVTTQVAGLSLSLAGLPLSWTVPAVSPTTSTYLPAFTWANRKHFGTSSPNLAGSLGTGLSGLTALLVSPLLTPLEQTVVSPLLAAVGVSVAGADAAVLGATCSAPRLVH